MLAAYRTKMRGQGILHFWNLCSYLSLCLGSLAKMILKAVGGGGKWVSTLSPVNEFQEYTWNWPMCYYEFRIIRRKTEIFFRTNGKPVYIASSFQNSKMSLGSPINPKAKLPSKTIHFFLYKCHTGLDIRHKNNLLYFIQENHRNRCIAHSFSVCIHITYTNNITS